MVIPLCLKLKQPFWITRFMGEMFADSLIFWEAGKEKVDQRPHGTEEERKD
jgi:hypothetical protein